MQDLDKKKKFIFSMVLFLGTFGFIFIFCEIAIRLLLPEFTFNWGDPNVGFSHPRNTTVSYNFSEYPGGTVSMTYNSEGFREDSPILSKSEVSKRVAIVGDSHTDGVCSNSESFPNQLEKLLREGKIDTTIDVINGGVGRYSPFQYFRRLQHEVIKYEPDVVFVMFYIGNDFSDLIRRDDRPFLMIDENDITEQEPQFVVYLNPKIKNNIFFRSRVIQGLYKIVTKTSLHYQITRAKLLYDNSSQSSNGSFSAVFEYMKSIKHLTGVHRHFVTQTLGQYLFFSSFPETESKVDRYVEYTLEQFVTFGKEKDIEIVLAPIPTKIQIESEGIAENYPSLEKESGFTLKEIRDFEEKKYNDLLAMAEKIGLTAIDLRPELHKASQNSQLYYNEDFHLNVSGNQAVAEILYTYFE